VHVTRPFKPGKIINFIAILFYFPFQQQKKNREIFMLRCFAVAVVHFSNEPAPDERAPNAFV
jgi:hypothetical protein